MLKVDENSYTGTYSCTWHTLKLRLAQAGAKPETEPWSPWWQTLHWHLTLGRILTLSEKKLTLGLTHVGENLTAGLAHVGKKHLIITKCCWKTLHWLKLVTNFTLDLLMLVTNFRPEHTHSTLMRNLTLNLAYAGIKSYTKNCSCLLGFTHVGEKPYTETCLWWWQTLHNTY